MLYDNPLELIGNTPMLKLKSFSTNDYTVYAKLEMFNLAGSSKDRVALQMINDAIKENKLTKDMVIVEATSGNTGIGLSMVGSLLGYKTIIVMPDTMSVERIKVIKSYGAEVVLTKGELGMKGCIDYVEELKKKYKCFLPSQFDNPSNIKAHFETTGPEILNDITPDYFIATIGTGGTLSGTGKYLKENSNCKIIGVEPTESPLITKGECGPHKIQGIGANFIPGNFKNEYVDEVVTVSSLESYECARKIAKSEGLLCGISSGACLAAISKIKPKGNVVVLLPDTGLRYLSTDLF